MTLKEMLEKREPMATRICELRDQASDRDWEGDEKENWEAVNADYDSLTEKIEREVRADEVRKEVDAPIRGPDARAALGRDGPGDETTARDHTMALRSWARGGIGLDDEHAEACQRVGITPEAKEIDLHLPMIGAGETDPDQLLTRAGRSAFVSQLENKSREDRALSAIQGSLGAYTIPEGFVPNIERALLQFAAPRLVIDIMRTATGTDLPWPTVDDTGNEGELIGENTTVDEQNVAFGAIVFGAHKFSSKIVKVPFELIQDSGINLARLLGSLLGERLARKMATEITNGVGDGASPKGLVPASVLGKTTSSGTAITFDEVIDLMDSIDPAYRDNSSFMFHTGISTHLRKLKDGQSRYLWERNTQISGPDMIFGHPVTINQKMQATVATATKTILFGDFKKYKWREVGSIRMKRLEERFAELDQVAFIGFMRADGNLLDAGTNPLKHMLQA